jgi:hypothetical protein
VLVHLFGDGLFFFGRERGRGEGGKQAVENEDLDFMGPGRFYAGPRIACESAARHRACWTSTSPRNKYRYELQRKNELRNAVNLPVGLLSAIGGLLVVMAKGYSYRSLARAPFVLGLSAGGVCFAVAAYALVRAYVGPKDEFIPRLGVIGSFRDALEEFYEGMSYPPEHADPDFREQLTRWYVYAADQNTTNNDRQSGYLALAAKGLIGVLISMAICGILYVVDALRIL